MWEVILFSEFHRALQSPPQLRVIQWGKKDTKKIPDEKNDFHKIVLRALSITEEVWSDDTNFLSEYEYYLSESTTAWVKEVLRKCQKILDGYIYLRSYMYISELRKICVNILNARSKK